MGLTGPPPGVSDPVVRRTPKDARHDGAAFWKRRSRMGPALLALAALSAGPPSLSQEAPPGPQVTAPTHPENDARIVEGEPEGGLAYRLIMTAGATESRPDRLVVWLHPSGGSWNELVEGLAPIFLQHRLALLLMTRKQFDGWTEPEAKQLFGRTLPEVSGISGLDARRPILMGCSGGGQLAISLWHAKPGNYSGVILDAAFPLEYKDGKQSLMALPASDFKGAPLFVLVGANDAVADSWRNVESKWREAGVPITIRYVKGKGHEWLFGDEEKAALQQWLGAMADRW